MQLPLYRKLLRVFLDRIMNEVLPGETGAARLQQLGLFTMIYALEEDGTPVTTERLAEITGQSRSVVVKQLQKLEGIGAIERRPGLNKKGRGLVYHLFVKHNEQTEKLLRAIGTTRQKR